MKTPITLPVAELKPALAGLSKIVAKRASLPVLTCIRIERNHDGITLSGTDLDAFVSARFKSNANNAETASLLTPFTALNNIVKACRSDDEIQIVSDDNHVTIKYPVGEQLISQRIESVPLEDWPTTPAVSGEEVPLPEPLRTAFNAALQCVSDDTTRPILHGVYLDVSDAKCHCVIGTDGRHLYASNSFHLPIKDSIIFPDHRFFQWRGFGDESAWRLQPSNKKNSWFRIHNDRWSFTGKSVEGNYPNWRQVLPEKESANAVVTFPEGDAVLTAIRQLPDPDERSHGIGLRIEAGTLTLIAASNEAAPTEIAFPAKSSGNAITVHVNRNYLVKALKFGLRELRIIDPKSALQFTSPEHPGQQLIVMPIIDHSQPKPPTTPPCAETERKSMTETATSNNGAINGNSVEKKSALETAIAQVESVKSSFRNAIAGLNELTTTLRQTSREQKISEREIHGVRQTLRSLQSVKI